METLTIHFDFFKDKNISKDINLDSLDGCFYDGGNDPYKPVKCCEICYGEYSDGETIEEEVLHYLEYLIEESKILDELNTLDDIKNYFKYMVETFYK